LKNLQNIFNIVSIVKEKKQVHSTMTNKLPQESRKKDPLKELEQGCPIEPVHVSGRKI
jgi:hypothetical protein